MLAEGYGWFTEGFDTVDLQEARSLLEALSSEQTSPVPFNLGWGLLKP